MRKEIRMDENEAGALQWSAPDSETKKTLNPGKENYIGIIIIDITWQKNKVT